MPVIPNHNGPNGKAIRQIPLKRPDWIKAAASRKRNIEAKRALRLRPEYSHARLIRLRAVLDKIDDKLSTAASKGDAKQLADLARAADLIAGQECWLAGRPRPGVRTQAGMDAEAPAVGSHDEDQPPALPGD